MQPTCLQQNSETVKFFLKKRVLSSSTGHKVARLAMAFFVTAGVTVIGLSFLSLTPGSLKWPLRIGGGLGIGIGFAGGMGLLVLSRRKVSQENMSAEEGSEEPVQVKVSDSFCFCEENKILIESLKKRVNTEWEGWLEFGLGEDRKPKDLRFSNNKQERLERYHCPVRLVSLQEGFFIILPSSGEIVLSNNSGYSPATVRQKLENRFLQG